MKQVCVTSPYQGLMDIPLTWQTSIDYLGYSWGLLMGLTVVSS